MSDLSTLVRRRALSAGGSGRGSVPARRFRRAPAFAWNGGLANHTNTITARKMIPSRWKISLKPICAAWLEIIRSSTAAPRCRSPLPSARGLLDRRRVVGRQLLGHVRVVHGAALGPCVRRQRRGEAAAQRAHERRQARARRDLVRLQVRQQDLQHRHEEQRHAEALQQLHHRDVVEVDVEVEARRARNWSATSR